MKLAGLLSGGKDSVFSIYSAKKSGSEISCLISIIPFSEESSLFHFPNVNLAKLQAKSMGFPILSGQTKNDSVEEEVLTLKELLFETKKKFKIEGIVHGGISSFFQKNKFERVCDELDLSVVTPIWNRDPIEYWHDLLNSEFKIIISSVSSDGLDDSWLGKEITKQDLAKLEKLSKKFGFNLNFEGGEAETLVTNCPLFNYPLKIKNSNKIWDGYRGRLEILEAGLR